jgi:hypothetical protein
MQIIIKKITNEITNENLRFENEDKSIICTNYIITYYQDFIYLNNKEIPALKSWEIDLKIKSTKDIDFCKVYLGDKFIGEGFFKNEDKFMGDGPLFIE